MRQVDLVKAFLEGAVEGKAKSLSIGGDQLIHYNTAIAERHEGKIILNYTRYSLATGKVQKMITDTVPSSDLLYVSGIPSDTRTSLTQYLDIKDGGNYAEPEEYVALIHHVKFGDGYVLAYTSNSIKCRFGSQDRTLLYPKVIEDGLATITDRND